MASVKFSEIKTPNEDDEYGYEGDPDKFKVDVNIRIGNETTSGKEGGGYSLDNWMSFDVPTPKPLSKEDEQYKTQMKIMRKEDDKR